MPRNPFDDDGPGRPVERIDKMLGLLRDAWLRFPDQRLGQLIVNAARDSERDNGFGYGVVRDPFNVEDDEMWSGLERMVRP